MILNNINLKNILFPLLLVLICLILIFINYTPGSWLSGWDTLHPEFNFPLNFQRLIFGVFRDNQGLGAVTAHSHMADLPRNIFLFISSIFLPEHFLRFFYIALSIPIGCLGVYFFIKNIFLKDYQEKSKPFAFLGALFYLFNIGILQHFYVPFEMFTTQFAFLPWLFLLATNFLSNAIRKNLFWFGLVSFFATPMAYASTLWFVFFISLFFYILILKKGIRKFLILVLITLVINSFWLFPNIYFLASGNAALVPEAKINKLFSELAFSYNKGYGSILDALIFKNFLFDWTVYKTNDRFEYLLSDWINHLDKGYILILGYILSGISILGLIYSLFLRKKVFYALFLPTIISFIFLINENPPLSFLFTYLRENSNIFKEALRFPFTKFSIIFIFAFSCYFALGQHFIYKLSTKHHKLIYFQIIVFVIVIFIYTLPFFKGNLIGKPMQITIPQEYFQMFEWFDNQEDYGRVAMLPIHSFWGWIYYNWGFQGSGFLTFGIKQPLLDRDFDRWNPSNEQYYKEMSYAIYSRNLNLLENILEKYQIKYLILDGNVIAPGVNVNKGVVFSNEIKSLISQSDKISNAKNFGNINVYQYNFQKDFQNYFFSPEAFSQLEKLNGSSDLDWQYNQIGDYIESKGTVKTKKFITPFNAFFDNQNFINKDIIRLTEYKLILTPSNLQVRAEILEDDFILTENQIPAKVFVISKEGELNIKLVLDLPFDNSSHEEFSSLEYKIPTLNREDLLLNFNSYQTIELDELNDSEVFVGNVLLSTKTANSLNIYTDFNPIVSDISNSKSFAQNCGEPFADQIFGSNILSPNAFQISSKNASACIRFPLNQVIDSNSILSYKTLLNVNFSVQSTSDILGHYCLLDNRLNRCINEQKEIPLTKLINEYLTIDQNDLDNLQLVFYNDNPSTALENVVYKDLEFNAGNPIKQFTISPNDLLKLTQSKNLLIDNNSEIAINLTDLSDSINIFEEKNKESCSDILPINYERTLNRNERYVEYASTKGSSCDYLSATNLPHNIAYLLKIESQNVSGLPLRICVANNSTKRCDLYINLPINKKFADNFLVIPPANDGGFGFDIHTDNISVGNEASINRLKELKIYPFPYYWLSQMSFTDNSISNSEQLQISEVKRTLPFFYTIKYQKKTDYPSLLVLNNAFEKGWISTKGEHVKVNSWANGWIVTDQGGELSIIYLPQLLELLGFIIIPIFFSTLLLKFKHHLFLNNN